MDLLGSYMHLGALLQRRRDHLSKASADGTSAALSSLMELYSPFNYGPLLTSDRTVAVFIQEILKHWPGEVVHKTIPGAPEEAGKLNVTMDKAYHLLGWQPRWTFE